MGLIRTAPICVLPLAAELGEGPIWSAAEEAVWFVDIKRNAVHRYHPATGEARSWAAPAPPGFIVPAADGGFICGLKTGLHRFDPQTGRFTLMTRVEPAGLDNRLNDGAVDPSGHLWFGSMHDPETDRTGRLYRLSASGRPDVQDMGYCITNGPAISPDGRTLYHTDTLERAIYAYDLDPDGTLGPRRLFVRIAREGAYPDGPVVDAEGHVWTGLFGGWGLDRYAPDGTLSGRVELPCANVTKAAFGGDDLRTLYITTARKGLPPAELERQPLAGGLFRVDVAVAGQPQHEVRHGL